jgi:hypothetical protein
VAIPGILNSQKAWNAFLKIREQAQRRYPALDIKKVQTDKGSEFMKVFRKGMKGLNARHPGYYQHVFGYTGRSQTQGLVERYNGTLKRLIQRHLNRRTGTDWPQHLRAAVRNYNRNPHSTIKMAPDDVQPNNYAQVKRNILERAKQQQRFQGVVFDVGDYVRLRIYKPKRLTPNFTYRRGPLYKLHREPRYQGVYLVSRVNRPEAVVNQQRQADL